MSPENWQTAALWGLQTITALSLLAYGRGAIKSFTEKKQLLKHTPEETSTPFWVCVPARNELERLPDTLNSLLADPNPNLKITVADDHSDDGTPEWVAARAQNDHRLRLFRVPDHRQGKPGALAAWMQNLKNSEEPLPEAVLFLDADVPVQPGFLGGMHRLLHDHPVHALSGAPHLLCRTFWEALLVPAVAALAATLYPPSRLHRRGFLNGQVILVRTEALEAVGGWDAVEHEILEDVALAKRLVDRKFRIKLVDLQHACATRMYTSLREIIEGFAKNFAALAGGGGRGVLIAWVGLTLALAPWVFWAFSAEAWGIWAIGPLLGATACQGIARYVWRQPIWPILFVPLTAALVTLIAAKSAFHITSRTPIRWRGRSVRVPPPESN